MTEIYFENVVIQFIHFRLLLINNAVHQHLSEPGPYRRNENNPITLSLGVSFRAQNQLKTLIKHLWNSISRNKQQ